MTVSGWMRRSRWMAMGLALSLSGAAVSGCATDDATDGPGEEDLGWDAVTEVSHSAVRRQSIGNCWIYATVGWVEALVKRQTREELNLSESYLTWWHWYDQIVSGESTTKIETGGHWGTAVDIILRHGLVNEGDFIPSEANSELSSAQQRALSTMDMELSTGRLRERSARTAANVRMILDQAFGTDMAMAERGARRASTFVVGRSGSRNVTLQGAMGTAGRYSWNPDVRSGTSAWRGVAYPSNAAGRTEVNRRVMRALNDGQPVIINWLVDFNALDSEGDFELAELTRRAMPGRQGGHLSVLHDYTVTNVPGVPGGTLGLGALTPAQRTQALQGTVDRWVIKNSWGADRADRASRGGYYHLFASYLNGPIQWRLGEEPTASTSPRTPLNSFILPPGY